jgi:hypothetical protein
VFRRCHQIQSASARSRKTYEAIARLGQTTTTADAEGDVVLERAVDLAAITPERLAQVQASSRRHQAGAAHAQCAEEGRQGTL